MYTILTALRSWFARLLETSPSPDALSRMSPGELADLPVHHPACDPCLG